MGKVLILCDDSVNTNTINDYLKKDKYKDLNIVISSSVSDIENEDVTIIIYISNCQRYNTSLEIGSNVVVNEIFKHINNEDKRILSSFSTNYYLTEASESLNKPISIVNASSSTNLLDEMYNKYSCLAYNENLYDIFDICLKLNKKVSSILKVVGSSNVYYDDIIEIVLESLL